MVAGCTTLATAPGTSALGGPPARAARERLGRRPHPGASLYGRWVVRAGAPAFVYDADHETLPQAEWDPIGGPRSRRHWLMVGNRAVRLQAANDGTVALFDEGDGLRWLVAADPVGTGVSVLDDGGTLWGRDYAVRAGDAPPLRTFGPTWFEVRDARAGLRLERTILCPEGEVPWLLVRVRLSLTGRAPAPRTVRHVERWALRPRFLNLLESAELRRTRAEIAVTYEVRTSVTGLVAVERFAAVTDPAAGQAARFLIAVNNLHSHAQPLLAYLRLLGVEPTARGTLAVGAGARFRSRVFRVEPTGHGSLRARGPVVIETRHGRARGGPGTVRW
jgi:hypothetical protein